MAAPGSMIVFPPLPSLHLININVNFRNVSLPRISHKTKYCTAVVIKFVDSLFVHLVSREYRRPQANILLSSSHILENPLYV